MSPSPSLAALPPHLPQSAGNRRSARFTATADADRGGHPSRSPSRTRRCGAAAPCSPSPPPPSGVATRGRMLPRGGPGRRQAAEAWGAASPPASCRTASPSRPSPRYGQCRWCRGQGWWWLAPDLILRCRDSDAPCSDSLGFPTRFCLLVVTIRVD